MIDRDDLSGVKLPPNAMELINMVEEDEDNDRRRHRSTMIRDMRKIRKPQYTKKWKPNKKLNNRKWVIPPKKM